MKNLKKIALCVDLTDMDSLLLNYIKKLDDAYTFNSLSILHLIELEEFSDNVQSLLPNLGKSITQVIESEIQEKVNRIFDKNSNINIHVHSGGDVEGFANYIDSQKFDLLLMGKKSSHFGAGILSGRVARLTSCDTLFLPEIAVPTFDNISLALDFSSYTEKLLQLGTNLAQKVDGELHPIHVIKIGVQYFPYIKNYKKISEELEKEALKSYKKLQKQFGLSSPLTIVKDNDQHISRLIYNNAVLTSANLILVGNKGKKDEGDLLIGSVAEQLIAYDKNLPVWIVK
ncbi:universal stress protein [Echinicola rosea]|uniref:UspA domain-containing protein n=1 Tax=Echinicola rosea TaxID=1807691 RepID=A0ABQ1V1U7_9BACT|nr:universal stress protein [Echinicola rosea]GGF35108.1 hypothetical protein GCM10011339_24280 [Echinicola rosea]